MSVSVQKQTELKGHKWQISCLEFSPGGLHLASSGWDKIARIWDLSTLESIFTLSHASPVTSLSWLPGASQGRIIASASSDGTVSLWSGQNGSHLKNLEDHKSWVLGTSFSSDGSRLATASWDKQIRLWDAATGQFVGNFAGHTTGVWTLSFHPDKSSSLLCSGAADGSLKLWDTRINSAVLSLVGGHDDDVKCCAWSPDGAYIASGSTDSKLVIWEPRSGLALSKTRCHEDAVASMQFYPFLSGNSVPLLFSVGDCTCRVWHPLRKRNKQLLSLKQHKTGQEVEALSISPDGTLLATGGHDMNIVLSNLSVSLSQVDALPIDEISDDTVTYGALLWQKYTKKVIEKSQNRTVPNTVMPTKMDPSYRNTSSLVGQAIHKTEQKTKIYKSDKEMSSEAKRAHEAREEQLLREQRAKLRSKDKSNSNPDATQENNEHLPSELEAVRQHLRHVQLEEHKENGITDKALDYTNNNAPKQIQEKHREISNRRGINGNVKQKAQVVLDKDGPESNGYHFIMPVQDSEEKNAFQVYAEIHDRRSPSRADSSSISSSSYYADIEEVTKEMLELADNQAEYDEKF